MGNRQSQSKDTVGHHLPDLSEQRRSKRSWAFKGFSVRGSLGRAFTLGSAKKDKRPKDAVQMFQPPLTPEYVMEVEKQPMNAITESFSPLSFSELNKWYEVDWSEKGELGRGHYATVYRGKCLVSGADVAVKKVSKELTREDSLNIEVEALRKVSGHPNIVSLYNVFLNDAYMYLVLELLAGGELFDRIVTTGAYSEANAVGHIKALGAALQFMHSQGIVHRDLKPENLVLSTPDLDSVIKISDFGLSKILKDDQETMMTICGTKAYSAPEVGFGFRAAGIPRNDAGYSSKVDMWSLGVILYVIVAGYV